MLKRIIKTIVKIIIYAVTATGLMLSISRLMTGLFAWPRLFGIAEVEPAPAAVVFGAGLWWDGSPTPVLKDRVGTAAELYFTGKVKKILMSGDNRFVNYNEPGAMRAHALELGVPDEDIVLDYAGRRTYDTCYRARHIFGLEKVILVTQKFHLPRAIYACNILGLEASGVPAEGHYFLKRTRAYWQLRESFATLVALWEVHITKPLPVLGNFEPIFPVDSSGEKP